MAEYRSLSDLPPPQRGTINLPLDNDGNTYIHLLCKFNAPLDRLREAIALGARLDTPNKQHMSPLALAIVQQSLDITEYLIDQGCNLFHPIDKEKNFNALYMAVAVGNENICRLLLRKGAGIHVNKSGMDQYGRDDGWHCLHCAINRDKPFLIKPLVDAGAFVNEGTGPLKLTPLQRAAMSGYIRSVEELLKAGASLEAKNTESGMTALHFAAFHREPVMLEFLLQRGADPDAENNVGTTPLMMACANASFEMTKTLIAFKANINKRQHSDKHETALMQAAQRYNSEDVINLLLKSGADPLLTDSFNRKASHHAAKTIVKNTLEQAEKAAEHRHFDKAYSKARARKRA